MLGGGDDAAILRVPDDRDLAATVDTIVAGVHFPEQTPARAVGHRALAVNLSDLAAMGAHPAWALLALTLPQADEAWLEEFAAGFYTLAQTAGIALAGGDTARGPLSITVTALGHVPRQHGLRRAGARPGDRVYVSGVLGAAAAGLAILQQADSQQANSKRTGKAADELLHRFYYPQPRIALGQTLRDYASAAIDVSDGLLADLDHILNASRVGATLDVERIPVAEAAQALFGEDAARRQALGGGDDYELCFTVPQARASELERAVIAMDCPITRIGVINREPGLRCRDGAGRLLEIGQPGFQHFRT